MKAIMGLAAGALICGVAATAFAGSDFDALATIGVDADTGLLFPADGVWNDSPCADNGVALVDTSTDNGRLIYQTALTAYTNGYKVRVYYNACLGSYPLVTRIEMRR